MKKRFQQFSRCRALAEDVPGGGLTHSTMTLCHDVTAPDREVCRVTRDKLVTRHTNYTSQTIDT